MKLKLPISFSIMLYILGAVSGFALVFLATWADVEAQFYGFAHRSNNTLPGLRCPLLMTNVETSKVSLHIKNTTNKSLAPSVRTDISVLYASPSETTQTVKLPAGESTTLEWEIGPGNIDLEHFIFADVLVYSFYPLPERDGMCGVFIVNLPTTGGVIVTVMTLLSLLGMGVGLYGLHTAPNPSHRVRIAWRPLLALAVLIVVALLVTFIGWWGPGVILTILTALLSLLILVFESRG